MSYRHSSGASFSVAAGGLILLARDGFTFVYHRLLGVLFSEHTDMADTVLAWICVALIVGGIVAFYLPKIRQTLFGTQTPDDVTPSGMKVYQGRVINLKKLSSTFFEDCLFCDVNFINEATVHIKGTNIFTSGYEVGASDCWVEAEDEQSIKGAVQFDSCIFIKCRIRTKRVATTKETRGSIYNNKEPRILKTIESAGLEYVSKGDYA